VHEVGPLIPKLKAAAAKSSLQVYDRIILILHFGRDHIWEYTVDEECTKRRISETYLLLMKLTFYEVWGRF
jgi:hypothetical protein